MYKKLLQENGGNKAKTMKEVIRLVEEDMDSHWGTFEPFIKGSPEYKMGIKLLKGKRNYKTPASNSISAYKNQITERGAFADGKKAERLFDLLKSAEV